MSNKNFTKPKKRLSLYLKMPAVIFACALLTVVFSACSNDKLLDKIVSLVDDTGGYSRIALSAAQSDISRNCRIEALFVNGNREVFYSVAKFGYNGDLGIAVLLENDIITNIAPVDLKETKEYGAKCFKDSYISKFFGINAKTSTELIGGGRPQEGVDIIYYTSATYTSKALISAVNAVIIFKNLHGNIIVDIG